MDTAEKINRKLKTASLSDHQMSLWVDVIKTLPESSLKDILDFINLDNKAIQILTENLVAKEGAFKSNDINQWEKVLQNDVRIVNSI